MTEARMMSEVADMLSIKLGVKGTGEAITKQFLGFYVKENKIPFTRAGRSILMDPDAVEKALMEISPKYQRLAYRKELQEKQEAGE